MNGFQVNPISSYAAASSNALAKSNDSDPTQAVIFQHILASLLSTTSSFSNTGEDSLNSILNPMMQLLEQLISQKLPLDSPFTTSETTINSNNSAEPQGRPVGGYLTQEYHPGHNGLDFGVTVGTPVHSTMNGKVVYAGWNEQGYGNLVIVENGPYKTYYAHLSQIPVSVGQQIAAGNIIGLSGNTGNSTGPHLHYEIRDQNVPINPSSVTLI